MNEPMHIVDWYPTLLKLAGVSTEQPLKLDGLDIWSTITQSKPNEHPNKVSELKARLDAYAREAIPPKAETTPTNFKAPKIWGEARKSTD